MLWRNTTQAQLIHIRIVQEALRGIQKLDLQYALEAWREEIQQSNCQFQLFSCSKAFYLNVSLEDSFAFWRSSMSQLLSTRAVMPMVACLRLKLRNLRRYARLKSKINLLATSSSAKIKSNSQSQVPVMQNQFMQLQDLVSTMDSAKSRTEDLLQQASSQNLLISQRLEDSEIQKQELGAEMALMRQALVEKDEISRQLLERVKQNM